MPRLEKQIPSWSPFLPLALLLIFGLAVFFRAYELGARDLWTDEAWVALAALQSTPGEALAAGQSTPPLYLLTIWATAKLWNGSEAALRSLSFLLGVGTILVFWLLARALVSLPASLLALALVSFSPMMVYYAKELKQYSGDAFFAVLPFLLVERLRARQGRRGWVALALAGILGLGFSHAQIFILPVAGAILWFTLPARRRPCVYAVGIIWILSFAVYYFMFFRHQVDPEVVAYWVQDFPDFSGLGPFGLWLGKALYRYFWYFLGPWGIYWGAPLLLTGILALAQQGSRRALIYLGGPLILAFGAAAWNRYPFMAHYGGNRLMLFSAPMFYLVVATGMCTALGWLWDRRQRLVALALSGLILVALNPVKIVQENLHPSNNREEIQLLVAHLQSQLAPQDWIYVYYFANCPFEYYFQGPRERISWGKSCVERDLALPAEGTSPPRRLWLIASHIPPLKEMRQFSAHLLGPHWRETACLTREGAALFQFQWQGLGMAAKTRKNQPEPSLSGSPAQPDDKVCE